MKIRTRIATATAAVTAALATVFVGAPAFAAEGGHGDRIDTLAEISSAGQPVDVVATSITAIIVLAVVLLVSTVVGNLFEKKN